MTQPSNANGNGAPPKELSALQKAYLKLEELQARLAASERTRREPIAIVGLACRLPGGVQSSEEYWRLLDEGRDAVTEVPAERWPIDAYYDADPRAPGKMCTRWGGFLSGVDQFDAAFFGISPREAANMDPQQRLLLEVAWEALENAGIAADRVAGSRTGVFVGVGFNDYTRVVGAQAAERISAYSGSGVQLCFAAGRISYALGLHGPSFIVDTACSSSLVALHQACQSLRAGECDMALTGGVNLLLAPEGNIFLSQAGALSPTGRCKTFDASADGMVRSDGCGVLVLKRLRDAVADGDAVLAVVRGSAVNHDGRSSGLTVPSGPAQEAVMRAALSNAGVTADAVSHVEAHGTGTALGDPIEVHSTAAVYGARPSSVPALTFSSVKTNLGHSEAASGVASVIKVVEMLRHRRLVPHLHFKAWNPHVTLDGARLRVPTAAEPWANGGRGPRLAAVSSFGLSGTNAHVLIEEAEPSASVPNELAIEGFLVLPISAKKPPAVAALARAYSALLASDGAPDFGEVCRAAAVGRSHHDHRIAVVATRRADALSQLKAHVDGRASDGVLVGRRPADKTPGVVFVFCAEGAEWNGMTASLMGRQPVFARVIEECDALVRAEAGRRLADEPRAALLAVQVALAALWRSWGVEAAAVIAEGVGELAAAHVAGTLSLADAVHRACQGTQEVTPAKSLGDAVRRAVAAGHRVFLEVGPDALLASRINDVLAADRVEDAVVVASMRRETPAWPVLARALGSLYVAGCDIDWRGVHPNKAPRVSIPTYPWQRQRFWIDAPVAAPSEKAAASGGTEPTPPDGLGNWVYELSWLQRDVEGPTEQAPGSWLLLADRGGVAAALAERLTRAGHECVLLFADEVLPALRAEKDDVSGRAFARWLQASSETGQRELRGVIHLWSLDTRAPEEATARSLLEEQYLGVRSATPLIQALVKLRGQRPLLWLVTRGVQAPTRGTSRLAFGQAPLWGLGRTCSAEHPDVWGGLVDLESGMSAAEHAEHLVSAVSSGDGEDQVAFAGGKRYVARLVRQTAPSSAALSIRPDRRYVVTGGLDGVGLVIARWLVTRGARHLTLVGRTRVPPREDWTTALDATVQRRIEAIRELEALGATVEAPSTDVASAEGMRALSAALSDGPPLGGVFHAASAWKDAEGRGVVTPLAMTTPKSFDVVLPAKVAGSFSVQELCHERQAEFLVFFSSGSALVGSAGQGNYAAANAFMDGLAHDVSRRGRVRCLSVDWGPISDVGFGTTPEGRAVFSLWQRRGIMSIDTSEMCRALEALLAGSTVQAGVMKTDWELLRSAYGEMLDAPWASRLVSARVEAPKPSLTEVLRGTPPRERYELLAGRIQEEVGRVMGFTAAELPELEQGLFEMGLDSLLALDLKNGLQAALKRDVPVAALFEHSSVASLTAFILRDVLELPTADEPAPAMTGESDLIDDIARMSESDVEKLLSQRITERSP